MFLTANSVMILVKPASRPLGIQEGIGITCRAICPSCFSSHQLTSKLYGARQLMSALRLAQIDIQGPHSCGVCGLRSVVTKTSMIQLAAEIEHHQIKFSTVPSSGKGPGSLHSAALLGANDVKPCTEHYILLMQSLPTLGVFLSPPPVEGIPTVRLERSITCGVCSLRISRESTSTFTDRSDFAAVATQLIAQFAAVKACTHCGSLLGLRADVQETFHQWLIKQLTPARVEAKLNKLRRQRSAALNAERIRIHNLAAPDCRWHVNSCGSGSHGPQLELQLQVLDRWHH